MLFRWNGEGKQRSLLAYVPTLCNLNAEVWECVKNLVGEQGCIGEGLGTQAGLRCLEGLGSAI